MGWAEDQARQISEAEAEVRRKQEWHIHSTALAKAEAPAIFEKLAAQISSYVKDFNTARGAAAVRCGLADGFIEIVKEQPYPAKYVRVSLDRNAPRVDIHQRSIGRGNDVLESQRSINFSVDQQGAVYLGSRGDIVAFAQEILKDVFDSFHPA